MPSSRSQARPKEQEVTIAELAEAEYDTPGELVRGQFIPMPPTGHPHATVKANLVFALKSFVKDKNLGKVLSGEIGIITERSPDTVRGADVAYISYRRLQGASAEGYLDVAPELVGEIISPHDRWTDINEKLEEYFDAGVLVVWLIDPKQRCVSVYHSPTRLEKLGHEDVLTMEDILPRLKIRVGELFED
jgi:Uma2 family endonuclease